VATIQAVILGFGTVGQGIYQILTERKVQLKESLGVDIEVKAILIRDPEKSREISPDIVITDSFQDIESIPGIQLVFEAIVGEQPAFDYLSRLISKGCHVITANKVMYAKYGVQLEGLARIHGVKVGYEATTAAGIPIIKTLKNLVQVNQVKRIQGILNGTSNYVLTQMRLQNSLLKDAVQEAQVLGYAEADPYNDISGQDAFRKLMILSALAFGKQPDWEDVVVKGIDNLTRKQVESAASEGLRFKHIAEIYQEVDGTLQAFVGLKLVSQEHPLYTIEGVDNAITLETNYIGTLTLTGPGAGKFPTASVMVEDYADIIRKETHILVNN